MNSEAQLPYLETFSLAAELSNFTEAAKVLGLTQAAVSQRMQALEEVLGQQVFRRRGGRVLLTESGQQLYGYAQRILELHREARQSLTGKKSPIASELVLAASSVPGEHLLPTLLSAFGKKHPQIRVRATISDSLAVVAQVEKGQASIGLVGRRTNKPHLDFRRVASDRMVLVVPPKHAMSKKRRVTLAQVASFPLILREAGSGLRQAFADAVDRAGTPIGEFSSALELGSNEAIKEAVHRGLGIAVLSVYAVQRELDSGSLVALPVADLECERDIFVVTDRRRVLPLPARLFMTFLEGHPIPAYPKVHQ